MAGKIGNETWLMLGAFFLGIWFLTQQIVQPAVITTGGGGVSTTNVDLNPVVTPSFKFTAQRMFLSGTAITTEFARVLLPNGDVMKDLGQTSTNSGTLTTEPGKAYKIYIGENSTIYYTQPKPTTAAAQSTAQLVTGDLCLMGGVTITIKDENGQVQSSSANAQAIAADGEKIIKVKVVGNASNQCYGNPNAAGDNAMCFRYNTTKFLSVEMDTGNIGTPEPITSLYSGLGYSISCYKMDKLTKLVEKEYPVVLKASSTEPTVNDNMTIYTKDIDFDLNADTLAEIWGYSDEDNNDLGKEPISGTIYIS